MYRGRGRARGGRARLGVREGMWMRRGGHVDEEAACGRVPPPSTRP